MLFVLSHITDTNCLVEEIIFWDGSENAKYFVFFVDQTNVIHAISWNSIITNIDFDHPDYLQAQDIAPNDYVNKSPKVCLIVLSCVRVNVIYYYGFEAANNDCFFYRFSYRFRGQELGQFHIPTFEDAYHECDWLLWLWLGYWTLE